MHFFEEASTFDTTAARCEDVALSWNAPKTGIFARGAKRMDIAIVRLNISLR